MAIITLNGTVTLDESSGLQTGGVAAGFEDNNDSDVALSTLQASAAPFYSRLFDATELGLSTSFATQNGVARSASNFITVSGGTVTSLGFVDGNGTALPVYGSGSAGAATGLNAVDGGAITLFADAAGELGNRMALGVDTAGNVVFAIYMDPNSTLTAARVWMVQFEAIANPDATHHDDPVNLFDSIGVAASTSLDFNFNALPSGQNLFGTVGSTTEAIVVIGKTIALAADGTFTNASNTINTSQGGGPTTIGVNNQMFDAGEGAYFTYVKSPAPAYLAGAPGGLDQGEADDADNIQYSGGTLEANSAFAVISQLQGNSTATMRITAYDIGDAPQGRNFVSGANGLGTGAVVPITGVTVNGVAVTFTTVNGGAQVSGLQAGDKVEWTTSAVHDRVLLEGVAGKFDIGGFGISQPQPTPDQSLDFVARATDGDGDSVIAAFKIGIDGTGIHDDGLVAGVLV